MDNIDKKIIEFFINNEKVDDKAVHKLSETLGINPHDFEGRIYGILSSFLSQGRSKGKRPSEGMNIYDLNKAINVEMEHTSNPEIAKKIVFDHLSEFGMDYYKDLGKMENKLKGDKTMDMKKVASLLDGIARKAEDMERKAVSLEQRKKDYIKNMDTDKMTPVEYANTKKKIKGMTEDEFNAIFKAMHKRGDL